MSEPELPALPLEPARLRQADHQLRRRQHLGQGHRDRPADRRAGRGALGQGLGRRRRHDQARRLRHPLHGEARGAEGALPRPRARGRDGGLPAALHLQTSTRAPPRSTRRCTPTCPRRHVDHMHADAIIAIAASKNSQGADRARSSATRSAGCRGGGPGFELGLWLEKFCRENPDAKGVVLGEPRALHLGRHRARTATRPRSRIINRAIDWLETETAGKPAFGGARHAALCRRGAPRARRGADAGDPRHGLAGAPAWSGTSTTRPAVLEFVNARDMRAAGGARHQLPRPLPAHQDPAAGRRLRPGQARRRRDPRRPAGRGRGLPRGLRRLLRALQAPRQPGAARPERGGLPRPRRRHDHLRQGQGDGADLGRVLRQRHQRDARRRPRSRSTAACRSRRPSTSSTGCSRRPSCSACRSRRASPAASPSSPAAPAASARPPPSGCCRGRLRRAGRHRRRGAGETTGAGLAGALRPATWCAPSR